MMRKSTNNVRLTKVVINQKTAFSKERDFITKKVIMETSIPSEIIEAVDFDKLVQNEIIPKQGNLQGRLS